MTGVANRGQISIAHGSFAGREQCFTHLGSDPYWRVDVNGDPWPGCAPGRAVTFFCVAKRKSPKKRPPPLPASQRYRTGKPAVLALGGVWLNSPAAQTTPALIRPKLRSSAHLEGDPGYGIGGAQRRVAPRARNENSAPIAIRSDVTTRTTPPPRALGAMPGTAGPILLLGSPSACAEERSGMRIRAGVCLSAASLARPRMPRAPQVPVAPAEGAGSWGAFLLVTFLLRKRKVTAPPGAHPGRRST